MSAQRKPRQGPDQPEPIEGENWVRVPTVVDASGDKIVTLYDEQGHPKRDWWPRSSWRLSAVHALRATSSGSRMATA
jgi:hypothetical protein